VNPQDLTIEDVLEMEPRERDRVVAEWMGHYHPQGALTGWYRPVTFWDGAPDNAEAFPKYSEYWEHAGRVLEAIPFGIWYIWGESRFGEAHENDYSSLFLTALQESPKDTIVLAACICAVKGIEPEVSDEN